jgi:hypothetical protein
MRLPPELLLPAEGIGIAAKPADKLADHLDYRTGPAADHWYLARDFSNSAQRLRPSLDVSFIPLLEQGADDKRVADFAGRCVRRKYAAVLVRVSLFSVVREPFVGIGEGIAVVSAVACAAEKKGMFVLLRF